MMLQEVTGIEAQAQVPRSLGAIGRCLLDGVVVPFVGAGISNSCKPPKFPESCGCESLHGNARGRPEPSDFDPETTGLKKPLARWLWARCKSSPDTAKRTGKFLDFSDLHCSKDEDAFVERCGDVSLDRLAEVSTWISDPRSVCKVLRIECFTTLVPRPAHRYIAYLVREGLVDEVVTTNWDTCIEQALRSSFGPRLAPRLDPDGKGSPFHRISRIDDYRRWGAFRRRGRGRRRPVLRLYKINGCAAAYERDPAAEADRIALTEHQLQGFRDNHWAADLFRDRARGHRLLFSGFGSSAPQIRHPVMALAREFSAFPDDARGPRRAPFVHAYEESPTFHQYQLLRAHYAEEGSDLRVGLTHAVTGMHAGRFPDPRLPCSGRTAGDRLDADRFWFGIYLVAVRGLVERYCESPFPFYAWLSRRCTAPAREAMRLRRWLYPAPCGAPSRNSGAAPCEDTFGRLVALFRPTAAKKTCCWPYPDVGPGPMRFWVWLAAIQGLGAVSPESGRQGHDWYLPLRDASLLVLSSMYVLMALVPDLSNDEVDGDRPGVWPDPGGVGLNVRIGARTRTGDESRPFDVVVVEQGAPNPPGLVCDDNASRRPAISYQLAVTNRLVTAGVRIGRWERTHPVAKDQVAPLRTGRFVRFPAHEAAFAGRVQEEGGGERRTTRTVQAIRLAAARLVPRTRARLTRRAAYGGSRP